MSEEIHHQDLQQNLTVKTQWGNLLMTMQVSSLTIGLFLAGYIVLWADRHNDARYMTREEYAHDRITDEALRATRDGNLQARLNDQKATLDSISQDVKILLREGRK